MLFKLRIVVLLLMLSLSSLAQVPNKSYTAGSKDISEIVIPAAAEIRNNFNLYYEVKISNKENVNHTFWYKFVFAKDGYFNLNVFPIIETDLYEIFIFKNESNSNFCDTNSNKNIKVYKDFKIQRTYNNDEQSEQFRSTLLYTKIIDVKANDVIYLEVVSIKGKDSGHILDFHTISNSFVMKIINESCSEDLTDFYAQRNISSYKNIENASAIITPTHAIKLLKQDLCDEKNKARIVSSLNMSGNKLMANKKSLIKNMSERKVVPVKTNIATDNTNKDLASLTSNIEKDSVPNKITPIKANNITVLKNDTDKVIQSLPIAIAPQQIIDSISIKKIIKEETEKSKALELALQNNVKSSENSLEKAITTDLENMLAVKCVIKDRQTSKSALAKLRIYNEVTGEKIELLKDDNGGYEFLIEKGKRYKIECDAIGYKPYDKTIVLSNNIDKDNMFTLKFEKLKVGDNFVLKNIFFHPNTSKFKVEANASLEQLYNFMLTNKEVKIEIDGHTNGKKRKKGDYNTGGVDRSYYISGNVKKLSKVRAEEVKKYLINKGINEKRIKTKGLGGSKPIYETPQTDDEGLKNMRVEVIILGM